MKFVIKSLLFVNLLLQLTSSLRKCFDHDQNLMLTIILLAFSLIGLIGLTIGNRFILIIFAACMTLMLIASITIYAIGKTEKDSMQPKVPYYINVPQGDHDDQRQRANDPNKLKTLVSKLLNRNPNHQRPSNSGSESGLFKNTNNNINNKRLRNNTRTRANNYDASQIRRTMASGSGRLNLATGGGSPTGNSSSLLMLVPPTNLVEDYTDTEQNNQAQLLAAELKPPTLAARGLETSPTTNSMKNVLLSSQDQLVKNNALLDRQRDIQDQDLDGDLNQVRSEQWIAYERYLYEKYLNIVSQSIDLIMHTILASWMALLLDDDADQCFGSKHSSNRSKLARGSGGGGGAGADGHGKEAPVYNYNGVRYSIRPDGADDSPARVVVR